MALLDVDGLSVTIGATQLLRAMSFNLAPGEVLGLVGESGAGKSLTALAISRLLPPTASAAGRIVFADRVLTELGEPQLCEIRGRGIGMVFQEPATALNPLKTIGAQVAETVEVHLDVSRTESREAAARALARVGLDPARIPPERYPHELSGGQRQRVALALATALVPQLLIADEPTTALDVANQAQVLSLLRELAARDGMAVLLISHDLAFVAAAADRLAILTHGTIIETGPTGELLRHPATEYTAALVRAFALGRAPARPPLALAPPLLAATGLVRAYPARGTRGASGLSERALDGVNVTIRRGERVGLVGESGAGKSTLVRTLLALEAPDAGSVRLGGQAFLARATLAQRPLRRQVQAVFQDPYGSLNPRYRVARIVAEPLALLDAAPTRAERTARVQRALEDVGLDAAAAKRFPHEFSGGERQRIALARALIVDPALLILDEAVSSLDASRRAEILALLMALSDARGLAYLLVSHDIAVIRATTDRVLVMQAGRIVEEGITAEVLDQPQDPYTRALIEATPDLARQVGAASGA